MPLSYYLEPSAGKPIAQGEILRDLIEYRPASLPQATTYQADVLPLSHPLVVVMTNVCDLEREFEHRTVNSGVDTTLSVGPLSHILLCDLHESAELKSGIKGSDIWKRVVSNQDMRYHKLPSADIGDPPTGQLGEQIADFREAFSQPAAIVYDGIEAGVVARVAEIPPIYMHDLVHRFYAYLSRVGLP